MRLRNIPGADEAIAASPYCIQQPDLRRGLWHSLFQNTHPIHIEVGMGKGQFLLALSRKNPDVNYLGIEKYTSVLLRAVQKREQMESNSPQAPPNLYFICTDAARLPDIFAPEEVSKIYLNFSDPWPKERHARRRLTSREFLSCYGQFLSADGTLEFKTDNLQLFQFSLQEIPCAQWKLLAHTYDLHHDQSLNADNIMTEYEEKFSALGNPIYKLIAAKK